MSQELTYIPFEFTPDLIQTPMTLDDLVYQEPYPVNPEVQNSCGYMSAAASSVHQCESRLVSAFFSPENVETVQQSIRHRFYTVSGYSIDRQKPEDLISIMRSVFITNSRNLPDNIAEQVSSMNQKVVDICLPMIARGVEQFMGYIKDASSLPEPIPRGTATSVKGLLPSEIRYGF
jgi:hypothetical protein